MFYSAQMDNALRFGDVLKGYIIANSNIKEPALTASTKDYHIDVRVPLFCVALSPCCSIGYKTIALSPLLEVRNTLFKNPYFVDDLRRINREMEPEQAVPPQVWERLDSQEKQRRLEEGYGYAFLELFIFEPNELFPKYTVHLKEGNVETNFYMIDFRNIYKVDCEKIISAKDAPIASKCLQLTIDGRSELRDKISYYYARVPEEDKIQED